MTTLSEFTAEILSKFPTYEKDIDRVSIKTDVIDRLRKFGNNIAYLEEDVLEVVNSKVLLPESFKSLKAALKVDPIGFSTNGPKENMTNSYIYKQSIENAVEYDRGTQEYIQICEDPKIITEKITINNSNLEVYHSPTWLSLVKGFNKTSLAANCLNLHPTIRNKYPHEINIINRTLNANFASGQIYIQYYSLPTDEEGEIVIPEYTTGDIYNYIENYIKTRIAEDLIANNLNPQGISQLYPVWKQEQRELKRAAFVESKFHGAGKNWQERLKKRNRQETKRFEVPFLNFR